MRSTRSFAGLVAVWLGILLLVPPLVAQEGEVSQEAQEAMMKAMALLADQKIDEGIAALEELLEKEPEFGLAWGNLGLVHQSQGRLDEAIEAYREALKSKGTAQTARYNLACAFSLKGDADEAFRWLDDLVDRGFRQHQRIATDTDFEPIREDPRFEVLLLKAGAHPRTCEKEARFADLDFWVGRWDVFDSDGKRAGRSYVVRTLKDCLVVENWQGGDRGDAVAIVFYDSLLGKWRQDRISDRGGVTRHEGEARGAGMQFQGESVTYEGIRELVRMSISPRDDGSLHQLIETSRDDGKSWETELDASYVPLEEPQAPAEAPDETPEEAPGGTDD